MTSPSAPDERAHALDRRPPAEPLATAVPAEKPVLGERLAFLDAWRGIAASWVMLFHMYRATGVAEVADASTPWPVQVFLYIGFVGVDIFFVISGFVIALTLQRNIRKPSDGVHFFIRRQIRLDPPYWLAIALSIVSVAAFNHLRPSTAIPLPGAATVVAHLFYVQDLFHYRQIVPVFWSLCFEVQFYLLSTLMVVLMIRFAISERRVSWILLPAFVYSLCSYWELVPIVYGLFINRWYAFLLGTFVCWYLQKGTDGYLLALALVVVTALAALHPLSPNYENGSICSITVVLVALAFLLAGRAGTMSTWGSSAPAQYLGRISYSLYLTHAVIGVRLTKLLVEHAHHKPALAWACMAAGVGVSILAADVVYRTVERPALRLSKRVAGTFQRRSAAGAAGSRITVEDSGGKR